MAYTELTTQIAGTAASAPGWANVVKANFESMGPHLIVRKPSDESVSSSVTQQADDHLILPLAANEAWEFRFQLVVASTATADIAISFDAPASATLYCVFVWANQVGAFSFLDFSGTSFPTALIGIPIHGTIVNGGTAGNLTLRWAQGTASGTTTMKANSTLWAVKLA